MAEDVPLHDGGAPVESMDGAGENFELFIKDMMLPLAATAAFLSIWRLSLFSFADVFFLPEVPKEDLRTLRLSGTNAEHTCHGCNLLPTRLHRHVKLVPWLKKSNGCVIQKRIEVVVVVVFVLVVLVLLLVDSGGVVVV